MKTLKKALALILAIIMLGSTAIFAIPAFAATTDIATADDFNAISDGGTYKLTADITISATLSAKSNVTIDGDGHSITLASGMTSGAFAKLTGSTVKNLTVKAEGGAVMNFTASTAGPAGVVGDISSTTLENVTNEVSITTASGTAWLGGVAANVRGGCKLINCVNKGNITAMGGEYTGGIAGVNFADAEYNGCKNYGDIYSKRGTARNGAGGIIGYVYSGNSRITSSGCLNFGNITAEGEDKGIGAFAGYNDNPAGFVKFETFFNFTTVPNFGNNPVDSDNSNAPAISEAADLEALEAGKVYIVSADFESAGGYTLPEGVIIDGNGHTITLKDAANGIFATSGSAIINNLIIAGEINATANGEGGIGALIGTSNGDVTLSNVTNNANITVSGTGYSAVGGFIGEVKSQATLSVCNNFGVIDAASIPAAGVVGKVAADAKNVTLALSNNFGACKTTVSSAKAGICAVNEIGDALVITDCSDYSNDASIKAVTLKLRDEVSMLFYIGDAVFAGADSIEVKTASGAPVVLLDEKVIYDGLECRVYAVNGIAPNLFGEKVEFSVSVTKGGQTYSDSMAYSVKDYCMEQITGETADASLKKLCVDLLKYGECAQITAGNDEVLVAEDLSIEQERLGTLETPEVSATNEYKGGKVNFVEDIAPVITFTAANGVDGTVATVKIGDDVVTYTSFSSLGNNVYGFRLDGLSAANFKKTIEVEIKDKAGATQTFSFNIEAYAAELIAAKKNSQLADAALRYINSVYTYLYDVVSYNIEKYAAPVWEGNIVYAETAFVREDKDNYYPAPITLLYPIDEIISVRSADMKTVYKEGVDYEVEDGKLVIIMPEDGGHIRVLPYFSSKPDSEEAYTYDKKGTYGSSSPDGQTFYYWRDPMYTNDKEGGISKWTVSVTYKHSGESVITTPTDQSDKFEAIIDKLTPGNELTVVSLGDSITRGCSASLNHREGPWGPKAPAYNQMFCDYLEAAYGVTVTHKNLAVDGKTSSWGNEAAQINAVVNAKPDILILAFGMNEGGLSPEQHVSQTKSIIDKVQAECPDTYVIVVSTCLLGQGYSASNQNRPFFGDALEAAFKDTEKVIVANVTKADVEMEGYDTENETNHTGPKCYEDLTGSGSNHPNDFMHRIYLQVMIQAAFGENKFAN